RVVLVEVRRSRFSNRRETPEIYTLSLHDALPICRQQVGDGDGRQDADDRHDDQQLDQCETLLFPHTTDPPYMGSACAGYIPKVWTYVSDLTSSVYQFYLRSEERRVGKEWRFWRSLVVKRKRY